QQALTLQELARLVNLVAHVDSAGEVAVDDDHAAARGDDAAKNSTEEPLDNHRVAADRSIARIRVVNQKSARSRKHSWASRDMMKASESLLRCVERLRKLRTRFGSNSPSRYVSGRADELVFHTQLEGVDLREVVGLTQ